MSYELVFALVDFRLWRESLKQQIFFIIITHGQTVDHRCSIFKCGDSVLHAHQSVSSRGRFTQDQSFCRERTAYQERKAKYLTGRATRTYNTNRYPLIPIHIHPHWALLGKKSTKFSQHARTSLPGNTTVMVSDTNTPAIFIWGQSIHTHWVY